MTAGYPRLPLPADDVVKKLAELQTNPDGIEAGLALYVGEAVTNYTLDAPTGTMQRFQAAMLAAMGPDSDSDAE